METPTPSRENFFAAWVASATPPMQVSARTHSTGKPLAWRKFSSSSRATRLAIPIVCASKDSRTPFRRPSIVGRIPILGGAPINRLRGEVDGKSCWEDMISSLGGHQGVGRFYSPNSNRLEMRLLAADSPIILRFQNQYRGKSCIEIKMGVIFHHYKRVFFRESSRARLTARLYAERRIRLAY
jgi:hypothetical protein